MFKGRKLPLTLAFGVLIGLAFGASCNGFFVDPVLTSIAISPLSPQVQKDETITLQVFGNYDDGTRKQVKSGISWSSSDLSVGTIDKNGVLSGIGAGTTTITADAQALESTATATIFVVITDIQVNPKTQTIQRGNTADPFTFTATDSNNQPFPLTTENGGTLNIVPSTSDVTCEASAGTELCSADSNTTPGTFQITMTYPGSSKSATATLIVTQ